MRLTRIYQQQILYCGQQFTLSKEAAHHLTHVLRLKQGMEFILFNGKGGEFKAELISIKKASVTVQVGEYNDINRESSLPILLAQAVLRTEKMDYLIQKAVELGATNIIPLLTEHALLRLSNERWEKRLNHWRTIMINACEQAGRTRLPIITKPLPFIHALHEINTELRVMLIPNHKNKKVIPHAQALRDVAILSGPEGGWSETEMRFAMDAGFVPLQLGPRILRAETAGLVAISLFQGLFGDISLNLD
jgi:16S rRNA (uracil1498-N3)-methyltransferase